MSPVSSLASISHSVDLGRLVLRRRHPPYLRHPRHSTTDSGCTRHPSHTPVTVLACREPQQRLGQAVRRRVCNGSLRRSANSQVGNGYGTRSTLRYPSVVVTSVSPYSLQTPPDIGILARGQGGRTGEEGGREGGKERVSEGGGVREGAREGQGKRGRGRVGGGRGMGEGEV